MHLATRTPPFDTHALHLKRTHVHNACMLTSVTLERSKALMESKWQQAVGRSSCVRKEMISGSNWKVLSLIVEAKWQRRRECPFDLGRKINFLKHSSLLCVLLHLPQKTKPPFFSSISLETFSSLFCNSPSFAPFTFQHREKRPCTVSFPSNRLVLDSETDGEALLEETLEEENLEDANLVEAEVKAEQ
ncbi:hypothetical protein LR48_Vigan528s000100 [Vigna angularis]|uniref:Uncharacterized protein n=1 Tax=Phaseolus angularis TaxID=3914 RepID=A0A0L9TCI6_PHAAN|nr:hypothetical protein LR48_Vigan528s000100 [Vigna angularis]